jgi:hypothetical protein
VFHNSNQFRPNVGLIIKNEKHVTSISGSSGSPSVPVSSPSIMRISSMKHKDLIALIFIGNKEKLKIKYICLKYGNFRGKLLISYVGERARENLIPTS